MMMSTSARSSHPGKDVSVQGLRGFAILAVFLSHWYAGSASANLVPASWGHWPAVMNLGKYGVELFFMISGFVIVKSLFRHQNLGDFFIDRIARIFPLFLLLHFVVFSIGPLIHYKQFVEVGPLAWGGMFVTNMLLLPGVLDLPIVQTVAWSLSYEVLFYVLAGVGYHAHQRKSGLLSWAMWALACSLFVAYRPRSLFFIPGVLIYFLRIRTSLQTTHARPIALIALCSFFYLWSCLLPEDGKSLISALTLNSHTPLAFIGAVACGAYFFFDLMMNQGWARQIFSQKPLVWLGDISYSFYLLHVLVMFPVKRVAINVVLPRAVEASAFWFFGLASLALTLLLSMLCRSWIKQRLGEKVKKAMQTRRFSRTVSIPKASAAE